MTTKKKTSQINIRLTTDRHEMLNLAASASGTSVSKIFELAIDFHLPAIIKKAEKSRRLDRVKLDNLLKHKASQ